MDTRLVPILLVVLLAFVAGCASTPKPVDDDMDKGVESEFSDRTSTMPETTVQETIVSVREFTITPVYFDFDRSDIRSEFADDLKAASAALRDSGAAALIAGHTDDRGSEEYNLALGERRANSVRRYLYNLGVPMGQMNTVSYGEAQPAVSGSGETVWQLNRRADFQVR